MYNNQMICAGVILILLIYFASTFYSYEGLNIVYDGVRHKIIRKNNVYTCFNNNGDVIPCTSGIEHLYRQTLDPTRYCYIQKINNKNVKVCVPFYPTRYDT
jgi:hypothetical protein